ncbi:Tfp pilus assembly protein PilF [Pseudomonas guineae]|uniref:Tfp pilus assembly protein PilF n=1 Tax=Pseudomonas guineae TaxID=425504 RepID=A0A1I3D0S9_9PSED|nr:tetratricopeptide repeat protein [Pseudomonas guineae]SFH80129.1 Tfp pilus assembly protein PilF [Pseudomonas guineae]
MKKKFGPGLELANAPFLLHRGPIQARQDTSAMINPREKAQQKIIQSLQQAERSNDLAAQANLYVKLATLVPEHAVAHARAAALLHSQGRDAKAFHHIKQALELPSCEEVDTLIFPLLAQRADMLKQNLEHTHAWFQAHPNFWRLQLLALALIAQEQFSEAEQLITRALEHPDYGPHSHWLLLTLAHIYYCLLQFHESIACCQLVLELTPNDQQALYKLASNYNKLGQYRQAIDYYNQVLELSPDDIDAHHCLAQLMLKLGNFQQGWKHNEWRWAKSIADQAHTFNIPEWQGETLEGKRLLVWCEQGVGDQIMFATVISDLLAWTEHIAWECDPRLVPLLNRSMPNINFIEKSTPTQGKPILKIWPSSDYHIPAGSLCKILRSDIGKFSKPNAFLQAEKEKTKIIRSSYKKQFPEKLLVGISWRGGTTAGTNKYTRSLKHNEMQALSALTNVQFINLQYGNTEDELASLTDIGLDIYNDRDINPLVNIDDQAAQISALDLIITIDNTTVHLAGALGMPTYLLLPADPDWRWGLEQETSYWYPSVEFIRNQNTQNWMNAIETAIAKIANIRPNE